MLNPPSEPLPEMESRSEELRMLPQSQPIQPEEPVVEEVEDSERAVSLSLSLKHSVPFSI